MIEAALRTAGLGLNVHRVESVGKCRFQYGTVDILDLRAADDSKIKPREISAASGEAAFQYVIKGIELALESEIDAVVTGPIHKKAINLAGRHFSGHTEIFAEYTKTGNYCMMLADGDFRVSHVTTHVALRKSLIW